LILGREIDLLSNPVLRWMFRNVVIYRDPNGNIKLDKGKSVNKIDGIVAVVDAIGGYMSESANCKQIYKTHEFRSIKSLF
jgi:Phage terminase-like protein, large subunit